MTPKSPAMSQWQQRFNSAQARVKRAEAGGDPSAVRAAYESLRQVQSVRPTGRNPSKSGASGKPKKARRSGGLRGVLSTANQALQRSNRKQ